MKRYLPLLSFLILLVFSLFTLAEKQIPASFFRSPELTSPGDWISEDQIKVYQDRVIINLDQPFWAGFTNTNSMDPFFDETANAIEVKPQSPEQIQAGDVISYHTSYGTIIHRVIETGVDQDGHYYVVKGDNNTIRDPFQVRFDQVKGVVVAIIY